MNRVIKFRAWHEGLDKMFSAEEMAADQLTLLPTGKFINVHSASTKLSEVYDNMIPLQFTGLKDKNGKEIYEGDFVEHYDGVGLVEMKRSSWCLTYDTNPKDLAFGKPDLLADMLVDYESPSASVIGNAWENPELISKEV